MSQSSPHLYLAAVLTLSSLSSGLANAGCQPPTADPPLQLDSCVQGDSVILRDLNFETNKAILQSSSIALLDQVAQELKRNPLIRVAVQGHTDSVGSNEFNQALSQSRAEAVVAYLVQAGVNPAQMQSQGLGETSPMANNETAAGRALNRRVELALIGTLVPQAETKPMAPPPEQTVYISTFQAQPSKLTVPLGTKVNWVNYDEISHDVSFSDGSSQRIWTKPWKGASASKTFEQAGEYRYRCSVHKDVNGTITVKAVDSLSSVDSPAYAGQTTSSYKPQTQIQAYSSPHSSSQTSIGHHHITPEQPDSASFSYQAMAPSAPTQSNAAAAEGPQIEIVQHAFSPQSITVRAGTTVSWVNQQRSRHQVVFDDQESAVLSAGDDYSRRFDSAGTYAYRCGVHSYMTGTVIVQDI